MCSTGAPRRTEADFCSFIWRLKHVAAHVTAGEIEVDLTRLAEQEFSS
jgi:hypothetical protein